MSIKVNGVTVAGNGISREDLEEFSTDGITFFDGENDLSEGSSTLMSSPPVYWQTGAYGNDIYIALKTDSSSSAYNYAVSKDGIKWKKNKIYVNDNINNVPNLVDICFVEGNFFILGYFNNITYVFITKDGINYDIKQVNDNRRVYGNLARIVYFKNKLIILPGYYMSNTSILNDSYYSEDLGQTWNIGFSYANYLQLTSSFNNNSYEFHPVIGENCILLINNFGSNSSTEDDYLKYFYSNDGINFSVKEFPIIYYSSNSRVRFCQRGYGDIPLMVYHRNKFIYNLQIGYSSYGLHSIISEDGINWQIVRVPLTQPSEYEQLVAGLYHNNKYIIYNHYTYNGIINTRIFTSDDGYNWEFYANLPRTYDGKTFLSSSYQFEIKKINNKFYATYNGILGISEDGLNWTIKDLRDLIEGTTINSYSIAGNENILVIMGDSSCQLLYSTDQGETWNTKLKMVDSISSYYRSVCYGNGKFIAIRNGSYQNGAISTDGINWQEIQFPSKIQRYNIQYNGSIFLISGSNGEINYSINGLDWQSSFIPDKIVRNKIRVDGNKFLLFANGDSQFNICYTEDGVNFQEINSTSGGYDIISSPDKYIKISGISVNFSKENKTLLDSFCVINKNDLNNPIQISQFNYYNFYKSNGSGNASPNFIYSNSKDKIFVNVSWSYKSANNYFQTRQYLSDTGLDLYYSSSYINSNTLNLVFNDYRNTEKVLNPKFILTNDIDKYVMLNGRYEYKTYHSNNLYDWKYDNSKVLDKDGNDITQQFLKLNQNKLIQPIINQDTKTALGISELSTTNQAFDEIANKSIAIKEKKYQLPDYKNLNSNFYYGNNILLCISTYNSGYQYVSKNYGKSFQPINLDFNLSQDNCIYLQTRDYFLARGTTSSSFMQYSYDGINWNNAMVSVPPKHICENTQYGEIFYITTNVTTGNIKINYIFTKDPLKSPWQTITMSYSLNGNSISNLNYYYDSILKKVVVYFFNPTDNKNSIITFASSTSTNSSSYARHNTLFDKILLDEQNGTYYIVYNNNLYKVSSDFITNVSSTATQIGAGLGNIIAVFGNNKNNTSWFIANQSNALYEYSISEQTFQLVTNITFGNGMPIFTDDCIYLPPKWDDGTFILFDTNTNKQITTYQDLSKFNNTSLTETVRNILQSPQFEFGSYIGNGTYDLNNPTTLNFKIDPKIVVINVGNNGATPSALGWGQTSGAILFRDTKTTGVTDGSSGHTLYLDWDTYKTLKMYSTNAAKQFNTSGIIYHYIAIG